jgi:hypothetical protein
VGFGRNFPQSTKGANVITVPAAAISFKKSRLDTLPRLPEGCRLIYKMTSRKYLINFTYSENSIIFLQ